MINHKHFRSGAGLWESVGRTCGHAALEKECLVDDPHDEQGAGQVAKEREEPDQAT